jgi:hypothetical protein
MRAVRFARAQLRELRLCPRYALSLRPSVVARIERSEMRDRLALL